MCQLAQRHPAQARAGTAKGVLASSVKSCASDFAARPPSARRLPPLKRSHHGVAANAGAIGPRLRDILADAVATSAWLITPSMAHRAASCAVYNATRVTASLVLFASPKYSVAAAHSWRVDANAGIAPATLGSACSVAKSAG